MKKKISAKIIIFVIITGIIVILFQNSNFIKFKIKTNEIVKVTVQYRSNKITIMDKGSLDEFRNNFSDIEFKLDKSAMGHKGWMYWIKCYNSNDILIYDFTIQDEDTITRNNWFYKANKGSINYRYIENLFE